MADLKIKSESLAARCDICHQADLFDPFANNCRRCKDLNFDTVEQKRAARRTILTLPNRADRITLLTFLVGGLLPGLLFNSLAGRADLEPVFYQHTDWGLMPTWIYYFLGGCLFQFGLWGSCAISKRRGAITIELSHSLLRRWLAALIIQLGFTSMVWPGYYFPFAPLLPCLSLGLALKVFIDRWYGENIAILMAFIYFIFISGYVIRFLTGLELTFPVIGAMLSTFFAYGLIWARVDRRMRLRVKS